MKKILSIIFAAALLAGCTGNKAEDAAEAFISNYLKMDYDKAASYCDENVASNLLQAGEGVNSLDSVMLAKVRDAAANTTFEIVAVDTKSDKDKAFVQYKIFPVYRQEGQQMQMTLTRQGGKWLVSALE